MFLDLLLEAVLDAVSSTQEILSQPSNPTSTPMPTPKWTWEEK